MRRGEHYLGPALVLSIVLHLAILSLQFGMPGKGLPALGQDWGAPQASALPANLHIALLPAPPTAVSPPVAAPVPTKGVMQASLRAKTAVQPAPPVVKPRPKPKPKPAPRPAAKPVASKAEAAETAEARPPKLQEAQAEGLPVIALDKGEQEADWHLEVLAPASEPEPEPESEIWPEPLLEIDDALDIPAVHPVVAPEIPEEMPAAPPVLDSVPALLEVPDLPAMAQADVAVFPELEMASVVEPEPEHELEPEPDPVTQPQPQPQPESASDHESAAAQREQAQALAEEEARHQAAAAAEAAAQAQAEEQQRAALAALAALAQRQAQAAEEARRLEEQRRQEALRQEALRQQQLREEQARLAREQQLLREQREQQEQREQAAALARAKAQAAAQARAETEAAAAAVRAAEVQRQQALAAEARRQARLTSMASAGSSVSATTAGKSTAVKPELAASGASLASQALNMARRGLDEGLPMRAEPEHSGLPSASGAAARGSVLGPNPLDLQVSFYSDAWEEKVRRIGNVNYPRVSRNLAYGPVVVKVRIRSDGSLEGVDILKSSGNPELDAATRRLIEMCAPFAAFPPDLRRTREVIEIQRSLHFPDRPPLFIAR